MHRSHNCGELNINNLNETVTLCGWVQKVRNKGFMIWIDLRDQYGITQILFDQDRTNKKIFDKLKTISREYVLQINGIVIERISKNNLINTGEILIKFIYLSIDPYMRGRMNDGVSYAAPAKLGEPMTGETVGTVIESKSKLYKVGDNLCIHKGWQTIIKAKGTDPSIYKVPSSNIPLSSYLGAVGMPGRTAYFVLY